ncbi:MAG: SGNH/GDSL hydrolase family protein [Legionella sp.]|uniref:SGNH/GDSL hydrolase family protein n=1 Tax=Legionella sp. TaxID=459 RepID=UPI0039E6C055
MLKKIEKIVAHVKMHLSVLTCVCSIGVVVPNVAQAIPFSDISQVYFFGDSLTDSGFNNNFTALAGFPAKAPTFTTFGGYTWAQYIAHDIKGFSLPTGPFPTTSDKITNNTTFTFPDPVPFVTPDLTGIDYACGGAKTTSNPGMDLTWAPSIQQQIANYLATAPARLDPKAVYFIWSGANDILAALSQVPLPNQVQLLRVADATTSNIVNLVDILGARGAKRIVVMSLPNIGSTPLVNRLSVELGDATIPAQVKNLSFIFSSMLNQKLGVVIAKHRMKVLYFDTYAALDNLITNAKRGVPTVIDGQAFYFVNYTTPVCGTVEAILCPNTSDGYIFADSVHPTDMAHHALSLEVEQRIKSWS